MTFFQRLKMGLYRMMQGRNGPDKLGMACLWAGLILSLVDSFMMTGLLSLLGTALYIYTIWRMFSKNIYKRQAENRKYLQVSGSFLLKVKQFFLRLKNSKDYKYFKCPQCKVLLRLKRGCGQKHINCPKCHHEFDKKA